MKNIYINIFVVLITYCSLGQTDNDGFYFDGVDDYINVGGASNTNITNINSTTTNNRTYETWFKADVVTSRQFIMKEGAGTRAVVVYIEDGYLIVGAYNRADYTPKWQGTFLRKAISAGTWYRVALVLDNALAANNATNPMGANQNTALKFYLDGSLIGENSGYQVGGHNTMRLGYKDAGIRLPSGAATWINQLSSDYFYTSSALTSYSGTDYFKGYLWGFRLWNRVRTPAEIDDYKADIITTVGTDDLVAILDGDTFTYLNNDNTTTSEATVSPVTIIKWSKTAGSTDWNTTSNWVDGVIPSAIFKEAVLIQKQSTTATFYPVLPTGLHIVTGDLEVQTDAEITIVGGGTLEIAYDLTNDGTITVEDTGSLILREKEASISAGTFNVQRTTPTYFGNDFYSYWSSPVNSADSNIATVFPDAELIYSFSASAASSDWAFRGTADFQSGIGYAIQNEGIGGQLRTFEGNINKGDIAVNIYNTSNLAGQGSDDVVWSTSGDNLVGNPYPSAIDWDLVITDPDNTEINGEVYFWKQNTAEIGENNVSDYLVYNLTGTSDATEITNSYIGTGQGFFIKTESSESDLKITFKTTHQVAGENTQFYRSSNTNSNTQKTEGRSWFSFNHNDKTNTLLVGFLEGATNEYDRLYDAPFDTSQKSMGFYTLVNGVNKAAIQGLPQLKEDEIIVEMGYVVDEIGDYSIDIKEEYIAEDYYIYLLDTEKEITIDLKQKNYNFTIETIGENTTRFKIIYTKEERNISQKSLGTDSFEENDSKNLIVFVDGAKELKVAYDLENVKKVTLYNIQGREVASFLGEQTKDVSNLSVGVYIVAATLQDNRVFNKKIMVAK